ncbi:MAG: glutamate-5-semialdehyde dehydrogenase [Helicobacter sp.]|nr:glutamate-5-semialdehyde dehydrogenase [Helicobacter sp.]MDY5740578.1 glutamate-5-semialdehyde dehydrogenase [Helicobacter sp.]
MQLEQILQKAKEATVELGNLTSTQRNTILQSMAQNLIQDLPAILEANKNDLAQAHTALQESLLKRLALDERKITNMAQSIQQIANLKDPLNRILDGWEMPSGIKIQKVSVPLGVVGVIYESRPNVTSDVSALCFKSGNVCVLKGGTEALHSNKAILSCLHKALDSHNLPRECINMLETKDDVKKFLSQDKFIDLLIPRGGEGLIRFVQEHSRIPIIKHDKGICHLYIHRAYNPDFAIRIALDSKTSYPAACNAIETLLIDREIAAAFLPKLFGVFAKANTKLLGDDEVSAIIPTKGLPEFDSEWGANVLNLKIVDDIFEAMRHINTFGSGHSDCIVTNDISAQELFLRNVQSACVYANASTRFSDGGEFGFGAEVGISTSKLHARGPMGLESLTSYKYKITAQGAIRHTNL